MCESLSLSLSIYIYLVLVFNCSQRVVAYISTTVPRALLVCLGSKQQSQSSMFNLDPDLDGCGCSGLSFKGTSTPSLKLLAAPHPPRFCTHFSLLGARFLTNGAQSEYRLDLGAQEAPFWLPFWSPFWVRLQSEN